MPPDGRQGGGLLLVHAHPDDECFATGGLIARSIAEGRRVDLVVCTGGEEGEIHDPDLDAEEARSRLGEIRSRELECSVASLRGTGPGELHLHRLGYRDSGMIDTPSNSHPDAFWGADLEQATGRLVPIIRATRPAVMVTYDANGNYGHPDHINAHRVAVAAFQAAADPSRFPDAGAPHAVDKFYEIAFNRERWFGLLGEMKARGMKLPWDFDAHADADALAGSLADALAGSLAGTPDDLNPSNVEAARQVAEQLEAGEEPPSFGTPESLITTSVEVAAFAAPKRAAMECHRTQRQDFGWMLDLPDDLAAQVLSHEYFVLTRWTGRGVADGYREASLFEGLE